MDKKVLLDEKNALGRRTLDVWGEENGNLIFDAWDFGDGVEKILGCREYEWRWTVLAKNVPLFEKALESNLSMMDAIVERFSGDLSGDVGDFLKQHNIPYEWWSRRGD